MKQVFSHMYEWFGLIPLYSKDLSDFLKGWDYACVGYFALPWYFYIGWGMIGLTLLLFALQYDLISGIRFRNAEHWELAVLVVAICNFMMAFTIPFVAINKGMQCPQLNISVSDCMLFGLSNAIWGVIFFLLLSGLHKLRMKFVND